jgi:hypothetical protein
VKKIIPVFSIITTNAIILLVILKLVTGEFVPNAKLFIICLAMLVVNSLGIGRVLFR